MEVFATNPIGLIKNIKVVATGIVSFGKLSLFLHLRYTIIYSGLFCRHYKLNLTWSKRSGRGRSGCVHRLNIIYRSADKRQI